MAAEPVSRPGGAPRAMRGKGLAPGSKLLTGASENYFATRTAADPWGERRNGSDEIARDVGRIDLTGRLSPAERARTIVATGRTGALSVAIGEPAAPVSFVVNYSSTDDGTPMLCIRSSVAKAGRLATDLAASLSITETLLTAIPSAVPSAVSVLGRLEAVAPEHHSTHIGAHTRVHAVDELSLRREDAALYALRPVTLLVNGGEHELLRVALEEYSSAAVDPLASVAPGLAAHLSSDENGSLVLLARAFAGLQDARSARLVSIDRFGMDLSVKTPSGREPARLSFSQPVATADDVRNELNTLVRGARFKLGAG